MTIGGRSRSAGINWQVCKTSIRCGPILAEYADPTSRERRGSWPQISLRGASLYIKAKHRIRSPPRRDSRRGEILINAILGDVGILPIVLRSGYRQRMPSIGYDTSRPGICGNAGTRGIPRGQPERNHPEVGRPVRLGTQSQRSRGIHKRHCHSNRLPLTACVWHRAPTRIIRPVYSGVKAIRPVRGRVKRQRYMSEYLHDKMNRRKWPTVYLPKIG